MTSVSKRGGKASCLPRLAQHSGPPVLLLRHAFRRREWLFDRLLHAALFPQVGVDLSLRHILVRLLHHFTRTAGLGAAHYLVAIVRLQRYLFLAVRLGQVDGERTRPGLARALLAAAAGNRALVIRHRRFLVFSHRVFPFMTVQFLTVAQRRDSPRAAEKMATCCFE